MHDAQCKFIDVQGHVLWYLMSSSFKFHPLISCHDSDNNNMIIKRYVQVSINGGACAKYGPQSVQNIWINQIQANFYSYCNVGNEIGLGLGSWYLTHCGLITLYKWHPRSGPKLDEIMAWCPMAPSHYLIQCWLTNKIIRNIPRAWHILLPDGPGQVKLPVWQVDFSKVFYIMIKKCWTQIPQFIFSSNAQGIYWKCPWKQYFLDYCHFSQGPMSYAPVTKQGNNDHEQCMYYALNPPSVWHQP